MDKTTLLAFLLCFAPLACRSAGKGQELPAGAGLVSFDREPPAGQATFARPAWKPGDRFVYRKGHLVRLPFRVEADGEGWRLVQEESGLVQRLDADMGELGQVGADGKQNLVELDPVDVRYHWPLWLGKRWTAHFVRRVPDQPALPLQAEYRVDGEEDVQVPAGTYRCLRIWRTVRLAVEGQYIDRVALIWYSPELGVFVRSLDDGIVTELESAHRQ